MVVVGFFLGGGEGDGKNLYYRYINKIVASLS